MTGRREDVALLGATGGAAVAAAALLVPYLSDRLMHRDEALALMVARRPVGELLETVQLVRGGAPLHFLLSSLVAHLGGGLSATRLLSVLGLLVAVVAVGLLGRALFGAVEGVAGALAVALGPVALFYGQFARMYSLFLALTALALWCLVRASDTGEGRWWAGFAVFLVLDVYVHPYGVVVGLIAAGAVLVAIFQARGGSAWRLPLRTAAGVLVGTLPLLAGYLVLASRLGDVRPPPARPLDTPSLPDVVHQAFAHFVGVPRASSLLSPIGLYLAACAVLLVLGLLAAAREDAFRGTLLVLWLVLPVLTLAVVRVPGTDNHVRYVIHALPAVVLLVAHGAVVLGRALAGRPGGVALGLAAGVTLAVVGLARGSDLADYRYRDGATTAERRQVDADVAYLRSGFQPGDLFFGYDPAWGYAVVSPGENDALGSARGVARSEAPLVVRSLERLRGRIAHGWYVTLAQGASPARYARFERALPPELEARKIGRWVLVRTRRAGLSHRAFAECGLAVFEASERTLPDRNAPVTAQALRDARGRLSGAPGPCAGR